MNYIMVNYMINDIVTGPRRLIDACLLICNLMALCVPGRGRKLPPELPAGPERQQEAGHRNHDSAAGAGDDWVHDLQRRHDGGLVQRQPASAVRDGERELGGGGVQGGELDGACAAAAAAGA